MSSALSTEPTEQPETHTPMALIALAWTLVGVPLAYGLFNTVRAVIPLFTGG